MERKTPPKKNYHGLLTLEDFRRIPDSAKLYLLLGAFLMALPAILGFYFGQTGKFLVSTDIHTGEFRESVIYVVGHGINGAVGIVINKPVQNVEFRRDFPEQEWNAVLYKGGPVGYTYDNFVLMEKTQKSSEPLFFKTATLEQKNPRLLQSLEEPTQELPHKVYLGYAGWAPFQLEREIMKGHWGVIDYDPALLFDTPPEEIWEKAVEKMLESRPAATGGV